MQYHFKSPEQLQQDLEKKRSKVRPFRNRSFIMIFADIVLIVIIFVVARFIMDHYGIDFQGYSTNRVNRYGLEFSASYDPGKSSHGEQNAALFLRIRNKTDSLIHFPSEQGPFSSVEGRARLGKDLPGGAWTALSFEQRTIRPGEVELYTFSPPGFNTQHNPTSEIEFQVLLSLDGETVSLQYPIGNQDQSLPESN